METKRWESLVLTMMLCLCVCLLPAQIHAEDGIEMYRMYNPNSGEHFYTRVNAEKDNLIQNGWDYEGTGWSAPSSGSPVYRLYNANAGDHHYTLDENEKKHLVSVGWKDEGIGWYSDDSHRVTLYRVYNPNAKAGSHHYTTSQAEAKALCAQGWIDEGIGWYGIAEGKPAPVQSKPSQPAQPSTPAEQTETFIVHKSTGKFHHQGCPSTSRMKESNKLYIQGTKSQMIAWGYSPCNVCN